MKTDQDSMDETVALIATALRQKFGERAFEMAIVQIKEASDFTVPNWMKIAGLLAGSDDTASDAADG